MGATISARDPEGILVKNETQVGISDIAVALPASAVSSKQLAQTFGFDETFIVQKLGIRSRRMLSEDENLSDLASQAVTNVLAKTQVSPEAVELLLVVTQTADYSLPPLASIVQDKCGLRTGVLTLDLNLGCSGYVTALSVATSIMQTQGFRNGIVVTADAYSRIVDKNDRNTSPLFGDAATATFLSNSYVYDIGATTHGTDGSLREALILHGSGTAQEEEAPLSMDGRAIFNFVLKVVPDDINRCLNLNNIELGDLDAFVFHQANLFMVHSLADRLGVPRDKVVLSLVDVGNTTSSSIPIALESQILNREQLPSNILLSGFGVGLSWASTVLMLRTGG